MKKILLISSILISFSCNKTKVLEARIDSKLPGIWKSESFNFDGKENNSDAIYTTYYGDITMDIFNSGTVAFEFNYSYENYIYGDLDESGVGTINYTANIESIENSRVLVDGKMYDYEINGKTVQFTSVNLNSLDMITISDVVKLKALPRNYEKQ